AATAAAIAHPSSRPVKKFTRNNLRMTTPLARRAMAARLAHAVMPQRRSTAFTSPTGRPPPRAAQDIYGNAPLSKRGGRASAVECSEAHDSIDLMAILGHRRMPVAARRRLGWVSEAAKMPRRETVRTRWEE